MIADAGRPSGMLVDPFCGSGTIVAEALVSGWLAIGSDLDADAVGASRSNAPAATIERHEATDRGEHRARRRRSWTVRYSMALVGTPAVRGGIL
jgi:23S rRNA G2445 N2-methylase RlmL